MTSSTGSSSTWAKASPDGSPSTARSSSSRRTSSPTPATSTSPSCAASSSPRCCRSRWSPGAGRSWGRSTCMPASGGISPIETWSSSDRPLRWLPPRSSTRTSSVRWRRRRPRSPTSFAARSKRRKRSDGGSRTRSTTASPSSWFPRGTGCRPCDVTCPSDPTGPRRELTRAQEMVDAALEEARWAIQDLRPTTLDDLGLVVPQGARRAIARGRDHVRARRRRRHLELATAPGGRGLSDLHRRR